MEHHLLKGNSEARCLAHEPTQHRQVQDGLAALLFARLLEREGERLFNHSNFHCQIW